MAAVDRSGMTDDLDALLEALPPKTVERLRKITPEKRHELIEVVMDLGRRPEARFIAGEMKLLERETVEADLQYVVDHVGSFGDDNRAGIERTLHRISAIRSRSGKIVGLTCRIGRAVYGTIEIIVDIVESGRSILIMGRPGIGKTTMLREAARVLADDFDKRVVVVDTSNEIAGDGDIPHPGIGRARRMQVRTPALQHEVMIEAVENHMPEVIVIDEIGTEREAQAARTIAERGVQLIGTAHGNNLDNLMLNPTLSDLIGGIQSVTLGDEEARRRRTQKSVLERKAPPTFQVVVEIQDRDRVIVHTDVADTVDALLRGDPVAPELRWRDEAGVHRSQSRPRPVPRDLGSDRFVGLVGTGGGWRTEPGWRGARGTRGSESGAVAARESGGWRARRGAAAAREAPAGATPPAGAAGLVSFRGGGLADRGPLERPDEAPPRLSAKEERELGRQEAWRVSAAKAIETLRAGEGTGPVPPDEKTEPTEEEALAEEEPPGAGAPPAGEEYATSLPTLRVLGFGVSRKRLEQAIRELQLPVLIVPDIDEADVVLTLKHAFRQKPPTLREAEERALPTYVLKANTVLQMEACLTSLYSIEVDPREAALRETEDAIGLVLAKSETVELSPQNAYIRRLQHQLAERANIVSRSRGREPYRRVRLYPDRARLWR